MLMAEQPDLIVLGGDYVTWGDRQYVGPSAEALAPLSAPHGVFASSAITTTTTTCRRRSAKNGVQMLKDARTRSTITERDASISSASASGRKRAVRHRRARARRGADRSSCSRTIRAA